MLVKDSKRKIKTYKIIGRKYLNRKTFPYGKKINFNSIRKGEIIDDEVKFSWKRNNNRNK